METVPSVLYIVQSTGINREESLALMAHMGHNYDEQEVAFQQLIT